VRLPIRRCSKTPKDRASTIANDPDNGTLKDRCKLIRASFRFEWLIYVIPNTVDNVPIVLPKNQRIHQINALEVK